MLSVIHSQSHGVGHVLHPLLLDNAWLKCASSKACCCVFWCAGLDLLWRIYLSNRDERVANTLRTHLLTLYHSPPAAENSHTFRRALVE